MCAKIPGTNNLAKLMALKTKTRETERVRAPKRALYCEIIQWSSSMSSDRPF